MTTSDQIHLFDITEYFLIKNLDEVFASYSDARAKDLFELTS